MQLLRSITLFAAASVSAFVAPTTKHTVTTSSSSYITKATKPALFNNMGIVSSKATTSQRDMSSSATTATEFAKKEIESNKITIFSKTYCPHCTAAKDLLTSLNVEGTKIIELDVIDNGSDVQAALLEMTGQRTVPNVFINSKHLGGNDNTQAAYKSGKLQAMIDGKE